jgi:hypothetical protein
VPAEEKANLCFGVFAYFDRGRRRLSSACEDLAVADT